jgi:molybdopterin-biosynthesis enzyme MoeA-like protein
LPGGKPVLSRAVHGHGLMEGRIAATLGAIQARHPDLDIGSYPFYRASGNGVAIVAKGTDAADAEAAITEVTAMIRELGIEPVPGEPPA